mmetsp:Transcript_23449/g.65096  ORF Transcript_23449/g.65096 Transcript_23449/m.65096 type:complete len:232 (+) Transcript_23449:1764-2459(+)
MPKPILVRTPTKQFRLEKSLEIYQCGTTKVGSIRNASQQWNAPSLHHGFFQIMFGLFILFGYNFVDNYPSNSHVVLLTQHSIQFEFVESLPQTTIRNQDHVCSQYVCNFSIIQSYNASNGTMPRSFDQCDGRLRCNVVISFLDFFLLLHCGYVSIDKFSGVSARNDNRTHVFVVNVIEVEMLLDQNNVLVHSDRTLLTIVVGLRINLHVLLTNRLYESHFIESFLQPTQNC